MKKIVYIALGVLFLILVVIFIFGAHGDGIATPKIHILVTDEDNSPIQKASVYFFEKLFEEDYESDPKEFIDMLKFKGLTSETDSEGRSTINARFWIVVHFYRVFKMNLFPETSIPSDGILIISKNNYEDKKIVIDKNKYRQEIINNQTISFKIALEKL